MGILWNPKQKPLRIYNFCPCVVDPRSPSQSLRQDFFQRRITDRKEGRKGERQGRRERGREGGREEGKPPWWIREKKLRTYNKKELRGPMNTRSCRHRIGVGE